jgi:hypothetical protein
MSMRRPASSCFISQADLNNPSDPAGAAQILVFCWDSVEGAPRGPRTVRLLFHTPGARVLLDRVGKEMTSGPHESMGDGTAQRKRSWAGQGHFGPVAEGEWAGTGWAELHPAQEHVSSFLFHIFSFIPSLKFVNRF